MGGSAELRSFRPCFGYVWGDSSGETLLRAYQGARPKVRKRLPKSRPKGDRSGGTSGGMSGGMSGEISGGNNGCKSGGKSGGRAAERRPSGCRAAASETAERRPGCGKWGGRSNCRRSRRPLMRPTRTARSCMRSAQP